MKVVKYENGHYKNNNRRDKYIILTSTNEHPKHMNEIERNRCFFSELSRMFHSIRRFRGYYLWRASASIFDHDISSRSKYAYTTCVYTYLRGSSNVDNYYML